MKSYKPNKMILLVSTVCVFLAVFVSDLLTPLGYSHWLFYVLPLLIIYLTEDTMMTYILLGLSAVALVIGYIYSPLLPSYENIYRISMFNRVTGFIIFSLFTIIINKLIDARKHYRRLASELDSANKDLQSFSFSAAHDLRSPLNTLKFLSQTLIDDYSNRLDQQGKEFLERIFQSSNDMIALINDMLNLSKISLQEINLKEVDLTMMAESIVKELRAAEPERNVEFHINKDMKVKADSSLIRIVLVNLIGNAWKYTSKREVGKITIESKYDGDNTLVVIKDNGCGFDMKYSVDLFVPFKRLHSEKDFKGTGIGLSIVERVIRRHHGQVWGEGEVGKGATFYFSLPH